MSSDANERGPGVLRVLRSRSQTRSYYNKIARVYDLLAEHAEQPMRTKGLELLAAKPGERILEIGFGYGTLLSGARQGSGPGGCGFRRRAIG